MTRCGLAKLRTGAGGPAFPGGMSFSVSSSDTTDTNSGEVGGDGGGLSGTSWGDGSGDKGLKGLSGGGGVAGSARSESPSLSGVSGRSASWLGEGEGHLREKRAPTSESVKSIDCAKSRWGESDTGLAARRRRTRRPLALKRTRRAVGWSDISR